MTAPTPVERDDPSINRAIPGCWNCERRGRQQWSRLCLPGEFEAVLAARSLRASPPRCSAEAF
jgi:hypothetical protein